MFQQRIQKVSTLCLPFDIWAETMAERSFLGVTVHFLERTTFVNCAIGTRQLSQRHTADNVAETLKTILKE